jgi:hypothetical protein
MALRDWLSGQVATATVATVATDGPVSTQPVAGVATVAVASRTDHSYTSPETKWPEYRSALASGALVVCLRCIHYSGPELDALGHCTVYRQEAAPDVPFMCPSFKRVRP